MSRNRDPLSTHNERVKLFAGMFNALGLGLIAFSLLRPLVDGTLVPDLFVFLWTGMGLVLHGLAHYILRYLEKEVHDDPV